MVLPLLGGSPSVWNTCQVFFQTGLLLGYAYAHLAPRKLGIRRHAVVHLLLLLLALMVMPMHLPSVDDPPGQPIFWLLRVLTISAGLPFVLIASTSPLLQRWFAGLSDEDNPYFLYAASNIGSMLGLLLYPFVVEPRFTLAEQNELWRNLFVLLIIFLAACAAWPKGKSGSPARRSSPDSPSPLLPFSPSPLLPFRWILLAMAPSSLMLSVTNYVTTDIAPLPLLWMLPLALYLGSFVFVFSWHLPRFQAWLVRYMPAVVLLVVVVPLAEGTEPIWLILLLHLLAFFWIALVLHGELARSKPPATRLTEFYFWLAAGGVLGGMFNALLAPLIFKSFLEYPLVLVLAAWITPRENDVRANRPSAIEGLHSRADLLVPLLIGAVTFGLVQLGSLIKPPNLLQGVDPAAVAAAMIFCPVCVLCLLSAEKPVRFSLCLTAVFLAGSFYYGENGKPIYRARSFFGVHRVTEKDGFRRLVHGNTVHGMQSLDPARRREALTYFHDQSPIGRVLTNSSKGNPERLKRVGIVGLGTGTLATYAKPGQKWTFFEIDPAVIHIAYDPELFTFLKDSEGEINVELGDGRLSLKQSTEKFGLIVIDAFGSDSIPMHLLTREAFQIYRDRLQPGGILAMHLSNRYFRLEPIVANLAKEAGWVCKKPLDIPQKKGVGPLAFAVAAAGRETRRSRPLAQPRRRHRSPTATVDGRFFEHAADHQMARRRLTKISSKLYK